MRVFEKHKPYCLRSICLENDWFCCMLPIRKWIPSRVANQIRVLYLQCSVFCKSQSLLQRQFQFHVSVYILNLISLFLYLPLKIRKEVWQWQCHTTHFTDLTNPCPWKIHLNGTLFSSNMLSLNMIMYTIHVLIWWQGMWDIQLNCLKVITKPVIQFHQ